MKADREQVNLEVRVYSGYADAMEELRNLKSFLFSQGYKLTSEVNETPARLKPWNLRSLTTWVKE